MTPQCDDEQIQGISGQKGQNGFATPSGTLPYILLIALEGGHLGVGLCSGSLLPASEGFAAHFCIS